MIFRIAAGILAILFIGVPLVVPIVAPDADEPPKGMWGIAILFGAYAIKGNKVKLKWPALISNRLPNGQRWWAFLCSQVVE